jgi:hypothetical protein
MNKQSQSKQDKLVSSKIKKDQCCSTDKNKDSNPAKTFKESGCGSNK